MLALALAATVRAHVIIVLGLAAVPLLLRFLWPVWRGRRLDPEIRRVHAIVMEERLRAQRDEG